jgi:carboxymethylenebutenolidase
MSETLTIATPDGKFSAYVARPKAASAPAIVVIQEIFGINHVMRGVTDELAAQGFIGVCPDLFWRLEPGIQLDDRKESDWGKAFELYKAFKVDSGVADIGATIAAARSLPGVAGKVGVVGFCLGGLLTFLSAARTDADTFVSYYGGGIDQHLGEAGRITKPLLMHLAGDDEYIPKEAQEKIIGALKNKPNVEIHVYPGRGHAFARKGGGHYDAADAEKADGRTLAFFQRHLT